MTIRAAIVDDEKPARDRIRRLLADHPDVTVVGEAWDGPSAVALIDREQPDLCFLDVQMPEADGFEVLRRVRRAPRVIFTTAYDQYAVRAFEVNSLDYLLKPFSRSRFAAALDRARESLRQPGPPTADLLRVLEEIRAGLPRPEAAPAASQPAREGGLVKIPGRRGAKIVLLDPADVSWFEAEDVLVFARTADGRFLVERSLAELESLLAPSFFRTHRAYLVNLSAVAEILPGEGGVFRIVIRDAARSVVPLSRRQARRLREILAW
jgi:DNA-binding LytR/AlgR family response regulator